MITSAQPWQQYLFVNRNYHCTTLFLYQDIRMHASSPPPFSPDHGSPTRPEPAPKLARSPDPWSFGRSRQLGAQCGEGHVRGQCTWSLFFPSPLILLWTSRQILLPVVLSSRQIVEVHTQPTHLLRSKPLLRSWPWEVHTRRLDKIGRRQFQGIDDDQSRGTLASFPKEHR